MKLTIPKISRSSFFKPVDIAFLVYFRIVFGAVMLWEVLEHFYNVNWIPGLWINPSFYFPYYGFEWLKPLPGDGMYYLFVMLGILSVFILIGFKYRIAATLFFLGFSYMFLIDQTRYLNHFYLVILVSFLMIWVPANRLFSVDAWLNRKIQSNFVPAWSLWILRFQIGVVYFYGGIAKLNWDWLNGEPLRHWLPGYADSVPVLGSYFTEEWLVYLFSYSAFLIDLLVVPFLLWKRTRLITFGIVTSFHVLNAQLFTIGIFPWFMIFATLLFFDPSWPRFNRWRHSKDPSPKHHSHITTLTKNQKVILAFVLIFVVVQLAVPLRHFAYPGNVSWTEEGHNYAWQMLLRDKETTQMIFWVTNPVTDKTWSVDPHDHLTNYQYRKMSLSPDMILHYSHFLAEETMREEGLLFVEVRVLIMTSLNYREPQLIIDPTVNLAAEPKTLLPNHWILQLEE